MDKNARLEFLRQYVEKNDKEWLLTYLPPLEALISNKEKIDSEIYDKVWKNVDSLIYLDLSAELLKKSLFSDRILTYNAFISCVEKSLNNTSDASYNFMLFPGETEDTGVTEICRHKEKKHSKRLLMMDLPENMLENSENMYIVLCHELAHYVGRNIRSREERLSRIYNICARFIVLGIKTTLMKMEVLDTENKKVDFENQAWKNVEEILPKWIELYYEREFNPEFIDLVSVYSTKNADKMAQYSAENKFHMFFVEPTILEDIEDMMKYKCFEICAPIITECFNGIPYEERKILLKQCIDKIMKKTHPQNNVFSLFGAFNYMEYVLKESYADLISVLELELTPKQYVECICAQYEDKNFEQVTSKLCARMALVIATMCHRDADDNGVHRWTDIDLENLIKEEGREGQLCRKIYEFEKWCGIQNYFENLDNVSKLSEELCYILYDKTILHEVQEYLSYCAGRFELIPKEKLEPVRSFFKGIGYEKYVKNYIDEIKGYMNKET